MILNDFDADRFGLKSPWNRVDRQIYVSKYWVCMMTTDWWSSAPRSDSATFFVEGLIAKWCYHSARISSLNITYFVGLQRWSNRETYWHNQDVCSTPTSLMQTMKTPILHHFAGPKRTLYWSSSAFRSQLCLRGRVSGVFWVFRFPKLSMSNDVTWRWCFFPQFFVYWYVGEE